MNKSHYTLKIRLYDGTIIEDSELLDRLKEKTATYWAKAAGVSRPYISKILNGHETCPQRLYDRLRDATGLAKYRQYPSSTLAPGTVMTWVIRY